MTSKRESIHTKQSAASSRRLSLQKKGWKDVTTKKVGAEFEVWGIAPDSFAPSVPAAKPVKPVKKATPKAQPPAPAAAPTPASGPSAPSATGIKPVASPGPAVKPSKARNHDPGPRGRPKGKTTGVGIHETWILLFAQNEELPDGKKLHDSDIAKKMKSEFPGRDSKVFDQVGAVRRKYNRGGFHEGKEPDPQSQSYGA